MQADDPHYEAIKARAIAIVCNELHTICKRDCPSLRELCERRNGWRLRNAVSVALCRARDEIAPELISTIGRDGLPLGVQRARSDLFNVGNFNRVYGEIISFLKERARQ